MAEVRDGYKMTELEGIPENWKHYKISSLASEVSERAKSEHLKVLSVTKYQGIVLAESYFKKTIASKDTSNYKIVHKGDFAYATVHLDEGSIGISDFDKGIVSPMYTVFKVNEELVEKEFLFAVLKSNKMMNIYRHIGQGGVNRRRSISFSKLGEVVIPLPPLQEQKEIVEILSTVDEQIEQTEKIIEKTKELKKGLMQQLLTKGIGHTEFKQSELGEIPVNWEVKLMGELYRDLKTGATPYRGKKEYYVGDIPWLSSGELKKKYISKTNEYISTEAVKDTNLTIYEPGTFFIAITGLEAAGTRGSCGIITIPTTTNQSCLAFRINNRVNNEYLYYWYLYWGEWIAFNYAQGTKQQSLNLKIVESLKILLPPIEEQQKIASIISTVDEQIESYEKKKAKYEELKKGLMQQLLTGKVRVRID